MIPLTPLLSTPYVGFLCAAHWLLLLVVCWVLCVGVSLLLCRGYATHLTQPHYASILTHTLSLTHTLPHVTLRLLVHWASFGQHCWQTRVLCMSFMDQPPPMVLSAPMAGMCDCSICCWEFMYIMCILKYMLSLMYSNASPICTPLCTHSLQISCPSCPHTL